MPSASKIVKTFARVRRFAQNRRLSSLFQIVPQYIFGFHRVQLRRNLKLALVCQHDLRTGGGIGCGVVVFELNTKVVADVGELGGIDSPRVTGKFYCAFPGSAGSLQIPILAQSVKN
jgi:hypothetical protein